MPRLRSDTKFETTRELTLTAADVKAGVKSDRIGRLPGGRTGRTGPPPQCLMREVVVDGDDGKPLRLITNWLDLPAKVIADLYRRRWQVELFFRRLKVWANFDRLISRNKNGVTFQFYTAVIACLLMHVRTGRKVNKYALFLFGQVANGQATLEKILPMPEKIERERTWNGPGWREKKPSGWAVKKRAFRSPRGRECCALPTDTRVKTEVGGAKLATQPEITAGSRSNSGQYWRDVRATKNISSSVFPGLRSLGLGGSIRTRFRQSNSDSTARST